MNSHKSKERTNDKTSYPFYTGRCGTHENASFASPRYAKRCWSQNGWYKKGKAPFINIMQTTYAQCKDGLHSRFKNLFF